MQYTRKNGPLKNVVGSLNIHGLGIAALALLGLAAAPAALAQAYTLTTLASFSGTNGGNPYSSLTLIGSTLYGTTTSGGANNDGEVFSVPVTGGAPTVLTSFSGANGQTPFAGLTLSGGTLYGTTYYGGANGYGTVFSLTPVPEASSVVSLGLMLALGLGGLLRARRRTAPAA